MYAPVRSVPITRNALEVLGEIPTRAVGMQPFVVRFDEGAGVGARCQWHSRFGSFPGKFTGRAAGND